MTDSLIQTTAAGSVSWPLQQPSGALLIEWGVVAAWTVVLAAPEGSRYRQHLGWEQQQWGSQPEGRQRRKKVETPAEVARRWRLGAYSCTLMERGGCARKGCLEPSRFLGRRPALARNSLRFRRRVPESERSAATLAASSALACWAEKGWSEGGTLGHVTMLSRSRARCGCTKWRPGSGAATSFLVWRLGGRELSFLRQ
eukprot:6187613-Pleurochrysis_carterae.AAC.8